MGGRVGGGSREVVGGGRWVRGTGEGCAMGTEYVVFEALELGVGSVSWHSAVCTIMILEAASIASLICLEPGFCVMGKISQFHW